MKQNFPFFKTFFWMFEHILLNDVYSDGGFSNYSTNSQMCRVNYIDVELVRVIRINITRHNNII